MRLAVFLLVVLLVVCGAVFLTLEHYRPSVSAEPRAAAEPGVTSRVFAGHSKAIRSVVFSPDGTMLASSADDQTVRLWDAKNGSQKQSVSVSRETIPSIAFSPDAKLIAIASYDSTTATSIELRSYGPEGIGPTTRTLVDPYNLASTVAFSPDSRLLLASVGTTADVWDLSTGEQKARLEAGPNGSSAISPDARSVLTGSTNEAELKLWTLDTGKPTGTWNGHEAGPISIQYSADGTAAVSGGYDAKVIVWDTATGAVKRSLAVPDGDTVYTVRFSPDGGRVYGVVAHQIQVWNTANGALERSIPFESAHALAVSPDGKWLAAGGEQGNLQIIEAAGGRP